MQKDLSVSIINYKTKQLTEKCLQSIFNKKWKTDFDVYILDNASKDGSVEYLRTRFPQFNVVESEENVGFGAGHNINLKKITTKYVLILNSDTEILDDVIDRMVLFMDEHKQVGVSSCKIVGFDDKLQPNGGDLPFGATLFTWLLNLESLGIKNPNFHRQEKDYYDNTHEVGWVSGNFMIARIDVLQKVNFFTEDYFMYFEDVDLCLKVKEAGFKIMLYPQVTIKHLSGGSADNPKLRQWIGEYKGLLRFYQKRFGVLSSLLLKLMIYFATFLRIIAFAIVGKIDYSLTYAKVIKSI